MMRTQLKSLFQIDFDPMTNDKKTIALNGEKSDGTITSVEILQNVRQELVTSTRLITYYIPTVEDTKGLVHFLISNLGNHVEKDNEITVGAFINDVQIGIHNVIYSSRIYIYTEVQLDSEDIESLEELCVNLNIFLTLRSRDYVDKRIELERAK